LEILRKIKPKLIESRIQLSIFGILLAVFGAFIIGNPSTFLSYNIYYAFMSTIPFTVILAVSVTYIVILGEIDLSFPSVVGFCAWVFGAIFAQIGNIYLAFLISLTVGLIAGAINGFLIVKLGIPAIVATIGMQFMWRGLVYICSSGVGLSLVNARDTLLYRILVGRIGGEVPAQAVWAVAVSLALAAVLNWHRYGAHLLLVGDNKDSAKMMGINVDKVRIIAFVQMGFFSAFVGILISLEVLFFWSSTGEGYLMKALASVFIGGTSVYGGVGTIFGTFIGAIIIGSIEAGIISAGISGFWTQFVSGFVIVVSLVVYSYMSGEKKLGWTSKNLFESIIGLFKRH